MNERELDEVIVTLLELYSVGDEYGVSAQQFARLLHESVEIACAIADADELPTIH